MRQAITTMLFCLTLSSAAFADIYRFEVIDYPDSTGTDARGINAKGDVVGIYWDIDEVRPPSHLVFRDGFAGPDGNPNTTLPVTTARVSIRKIGDGKTQMTIESQFPSVEAMEQLTAMGMEEGLTQAVGQIDAILAGDATIAAI